MSVSVSEPARDLSEVARNYLANINPLASKIHSDVETVIKGNEDFWHSLKPREQEKIIDEALINSDLRLKYTEKFDTPSGSTSSLNSSGYKFDERNILSYFRQKTGRKLVQDEAIGKYRDEHSGPWSVASRSQQNLRICDVEEEEDQKPSEDYNKFLSQRLALEAIKRANLLSPLNKAKETVERQPPIDSNISYNKIRNEDDDVPDAGFISKFINRLSSNTNGNNLLVDSNEENEILVSNINLSLSTQHSEDSEEEVHHTEKSIEFKSLLDDSKGFDFLNNW